MTGILLAIFLGPLGAYRFYKKQYGLAILYFFTGGILGIGWLIDIISAICDVQKEEEKTTVPVQKQIPQQTPAPKQLRIYRVRQSALLQGFEKVNVSTDFEPIQDGIRTLRQSTPSNIDHPYKLDISNQDIIFKEMDYRSYDGLECFQFYAGNHHIGTLFDDNINRKYIQGLIQGKVDAVHIEFTWERNQVDFTYKTKLWMHIEE